MRKRSLPVLAGLVALLTGGLCCQQDRDYTRPAAKVVLPSDQRIDINHGTVQDLLKVPGMTPSWANRIVRFRPYRSKQDLLDQGIVPDRVYYRIRDYVIAHKTGVP